MLAVNLINIEPSINVNLFFLVLPTKIFKKVKNFKNLFKRKKTKTFIIDVL